MSKPAGLFEKNPAQHYAARKDPDTNCPKRIECIRVDGASDEGPSHLEVQFWWCKRPLDMSHWLLLVTVELAT